MDEQELKAVNEQLATIANGGEFDTAAAVRALAKKLVSLGAQLEKVRSTRPVSSTPGGKK